MTVSSKHHAAVLCQDYQSIQRVFHLYKSSKLKITQLQLYPHLEVDGGVSLVCSDLVIYDRQSLPSLVQFQPLHHVHLNSHQNSLCLYQNLLCKQTSVASGMLSTPRWRSFDFILCVFTFILSSPAGRLDMSICPRIIHYLLINRID